MQARLARQLYRSISRLSPTPPQPTQWRVAHVVRRADVHQAVALTTPAAGRPVETPAVDQCSQTSITVGNERVQVCFGPAQRVEADEHVVADGDIDGADVEEVEGERLTVVGRGDELDDVADLPGVACLGQVQQAGISGCALSGGLVGRARIRAWSSCSLARSLMACRPVSLRCRSRCSERLHASLQPSSLVKVMRLPNVVFSHA